MTRLQSLRTRFVWLAILFLLLLIGMNPPVTAQGNHPFPQTGYDITNDGIWNYFQDRGGVDTFGYPVSHTFQLQGFWVQILQRNVLQVSGQGAQPLNLLDPGIMPLTRLNGSTFPAYDAPLAATAPPPNAPNYGEAVRQHLATHVPNQWNGQAVGFQNYYYRAAPNSPPGLEALIALEVWGFPTSAPARDPNNHNFVYQRFQRGIMHYDATQNVTRGILLGDAFKSVLTGVNLPADLEANLAGSPFLRLYDPSQPNSMSGTFPDYQPPLTRENSDLTGAFNPTPPLFTEIEVYLIAPDTNGPIGCNDSVVAVVRPIEPTAGPLRAAIQALLDLGGPTYGESGLYNALWQSDLAIESVTLVDGTATIRLVGAYVLGGTCDEPRVPAQLLSTALQFATVEEAILYINGERIQ
jgi:hypothetical protein